MLKINEKVKALEVRAVNAVRDMLGDVPSVEVKSVEHGRKIDHEFSVDGLIALSCPGGSYVLVVEVKSNGAPALSVWVSISLKAVWPDCAGRVN